MKLHVLGQKHSNFFFFLDVNTKLILNFKPKEIHHGLKLAQGSKDYLPSKFQSFFFFFLEKHPSFKVNNA